MQLKVEYHHITYDDLAFCNNSEPEVPSQISSIRISSSINGHCVAVGVIVPRRLSESHHD